MDDIRPAQLAKIIRLTSKDKPECCTGKNRTSLGFGDELTDLIALYGKEKVLKMWKQLTPSINNSKLRNDEPTTTTKSADEKDSKISSKSRNTHFPPGEAEWL